MTFGSLFSGIGGLDLGLERAGMQCLWQCDIDPFCRRVLAKHWPDAKQYSDIREVKGAEVESVDVLCGGFPCQDISNLGPRLGLEGERSGLWSHFARLIREIRPRYVLVENVPGLLLRGMGGVLSDLADGGYDAEWDCLPAAAFGAPHLRFRIWLLAYPNGLRQSKGLTDPILRLEAPSDGSAGYSFPVDHPSHWTRAMPPELCLCGVAHGVPDWVARVHSAGNSACSQIPEYIGRRIIEAER